MLARPRLREEGVEAVIAYAHSLRETHRFHPLCLTSIVPLFNVKAEKPRQVLALSEGI